MDEKLNTERFLHIEPEFEQTQISIHGYENYPLVSLKEAIEPFKSLLYNCDAMIKLAKKNCRKPSDGLTQDESCAIYLYTMPRPYPHSNLFQLLQENFRSQDQNCFVQWFLYLKLFFTALYKLPSYKGLIYRGARRNLINQYHKDHFWWEISSCTEKMNLIDTFMENTGERTIFIIECFNGKSIRSHSYIKIENEILLLPKTYFQIVGKWKAGKDLYIIQLKEQISPYEMIISPLIETVIIKTNRLEFQKYHQWKPNGITIINGNDLNQLLSPQGIFLDKYKNIYIADCNNHRIIKWKCNEKKGEIISCKDQLNHPINVIFNEENHSLIITDLGNRRVIRWFNQNQQEILIENIQCYGLYMDKQGFLYVTDQAKNEIRQWKIGEKYSIVVAGGNGRGNQLNQLTCPTYIFVDDEQSIYISDNSNHRVMKWKKDAKEGVIVAGGNGQGRNLNQLSYPAGILVDHWGQIYIADSLNNRIMRWYEGKKEGELIIGGNGQGNESNQFNGPTGLSFDLEGNLYVSDCINNRIQKYDIILK